MNEEAIAPAFHGVLVTFKRPAELRESLGALERQTRKLDTLIVIDNSPDKEAAPIVANAGTNAARRVQYVATGKNLGPAGAIAIGMDHCLAHASDEDWICLVDDDDPFPDERVLDDHARIACTDGEEPIGGVGGRGGILDLKHAILRPSKPGTDADYLANGYCTLYRVAAVRDAGVFDPKLFFGFEEFDFGLRVRAAGWRLRVVARPDAWNIAGRPPSWKVETFNWRRYYSLRNFVYLMRAHGHSGVAVRVSAINGICKPLLNLPFRPRSAWTHLRMNALAIRDAWTGRLGYTVPTDSARRVGKPE